MEKYQDRLTLLASYLSLHTLELADAHVTEAKTLATATEEQSQKVMTQMHEHETNDTELIQALQLGHGVQGQSGAKLVMALKPDKLSFDANLGTVRRWKQRFHAFHSSSNLRVLPLTDQQAFLIACIDDEVANGINRLVSETMPISPKAANIPCCYDIIDSLYREKIPILLRRVQFMRNKQQEGQDGISWRKELSNLPDDASIDEMSTRDLLFVMYVTGIRSNDLREKLLEVTNPTIEKVDRVVDSFDQAKKQLREAPPKYQTEEDRGKITSHLKPTVNTALMDKGKRQAKQFPGLNLKEGKLFKADALDVGRTAISCLTVHVPPTTHSAHVAREVTSEQLAPGQVQTTLCPIWSEWRLTVIAANVRIALVDFLDLSEVDIPAGGFLYLSLIHI